MALMALPWGFGSQEVGVPVYLWQGEKRHGRLARDGGLIGRGHSEQ